MQLNMGLSMGMVQGGAGAPAAPTLPELSITPDARWSADFSSFTETGGRITSVTDVQGLADMSSIGGNGPFAETDGAGNKFWRFTGAEYLDIAAGLVTSNHSLAVFIVMRAPARASTERIFSQGSVDQGTEVNALGGFVEMWGLSDDAYFLACQSKIASQSADDFSWLVPGAQKQVVGVTASASESILLINDHTVSVASPFARAGVVGAELGRYAYNSGSYGNVDMYEVVVFNQTLTDTEMKTIGAELMAGNGIVPYTNQLVLEGDSIMAGSGDVVSHLSAAAVLSEPGSSYLPADWRVVSMANIGDTVADLVSKRDATNPFSDQLLSGQNVMAFEIGRNSATIADQGPVIYSDVVDYLNTTTTGILQRGWTVRVMANISGQHATIQANMVALRALLRDPQFNIDIDADSGGTYEGLVSIISADLIEHDGQTRFEDSADAGNLTYYVADGTHPTILGAEVRVTGGTTPEHGVTYGLS